MDGLKQRFGYFWGVLKGAARKFGAENASLTAAAISFYAVLSLLPLLLMGVAVLGYIVGSSEQAFNTVVDFFSRFVPTSTVVSDALRGLVDARGLVGIIGILGLLWTGSAYFSTLQVALNDIWEVSNPSGFIKVRIKALLLVLVFGVFLLLSVASSSVMSYLGQVDVGFATGAVSFLLGILVFLLGIVFAVAMFAVVYKYGHDSDALWRSAIVGGVFAGVVWTLAKELYRLYVTYIANFSATYGSLGGVILLVVWIYYSSMILLFGAELAYVDEHGPREEPEEKERMENK